MRTIAALLVLTLATTACDDALETVDDLRGQADDLLAQGRELAATFQWCASAAQLAQAVVARDVEAARAEVAELRETAPEELQPDLDTIAAATEAAAAGDTAALRDEEVQQAARDVYAFAAERCGLAEEG